LVSSDCASVKAAKLLSCSRAIADSTRADGSMSGLSSNASAARSASP
jgi:hypothetical protein